MSYQGTEVRSRTRRYFRDKTGELGQRPPREGKQNLEEKGVSKRKSGPYRQKAFEMESIPQKRYEERIKTSRARAPQRESQSLRMRCTFG